MSKDRDIIAAAPSGDDTLKLEHPQGSPLLVDKTPAPVDVYISMDFGTSSTKCVFRVVPRGGVGGAARIPARTQTVIWLNAQTFIPSEIAWCISPENRNMSTQLWAKDIDNKLHNDLIGSDDIFRLLKPMIFDDNHPEWVQFRSKVGRLPVDIQQRQCPISGEPKPLKPLDVLSDLMGFAYRYTLRQIAESEPDLRRPGYSNSSRYQQWDPPEETSIHVSILVPVAATPDQQASILEAADRAGIRSANTVGEPTAALVHYLDDARDLAPGQIIAVLDVGAGSVDLQVWKIISTVPLRVQEMMPSKTEWCGGSSVTREGRHLIEKKIGSREKLHKAIQIINNLNSAQKAMTEDRYLDLVERAFEEGKCGFDAGPVTSHTMSLHGVPNNLELRKLQANNIEIEAQDFMNAYIPSIDKICLMIRDVATKIGKSSIDRILMIGAGSSNYPRERLHVLINSGNVHRKLIGMSIVRPSGDPRVIPAKGAVLLAADTAIIDRRIMLRGYCIAWAVPERDLLYYGRN